MTTEVCLTVDVEDWYDGMAVLGEPFERPRGAASGLAGLATLLASAGPGATATLFVVGGYVPTVRTELVELGALGHEIASHGPDHGRLPEAPDVLLEWLRRGRDLVEQELQRRVRGFRSPRFDIPPSIGLAGFRDLLAEAGFDYVSDTACLGEASPIRELPVLTMHRVPVGGGSYQRMLPGAVVSSLVRAASRPAVLYYHSYDFGATLPSTGSIRSAAVAKQLVGRGRIAGVFERLLRQYGSKGCAHVEW